MYHEHSVFMMTLKKTLPYVQIVTGRCFGVQLIKMTQKGD